MITLIFVLLIAIFSAIMDVIYHKWDKCIFNKDKYEKYRNWMNPKLSWVNKWKNHDHTQGEKFLGSSTIFVFLTDLWHFSKFVVITGIMVGIVSYHPMVNRIIDMSIFLLSYGMVFEIFYKYVLIKK